MLYKKLDLLLQKILHMTSSLPLEKKKPSCNYETSEKLGFFNFEY